MFELYTYNIIQRKWIIKFYEVKFRIKFCNISYTLNN